MNQPEYLLITGVVAIVLLYLWNPQKDFIHWVAGSIALTFGLGYFFVNSWNTWQLWVYGFVAFGFVVVYALRFRAKERRVITDYFKWIGIAIIILLPLLPWLAWKFDEELIFGLEASALVVFTIYVYDRWVMRPDLMTGRFRVILLMQTVVIGLVLVYALVMRTAMLKAHDLLNQGARQSEMFQRDNEQTMIELQEEIKKLKDEVERLRGK